MPAITPSALRLFFASSAVTLFTKFEPTWAKDVGEESKNTAWNWEEEHKDDFQKKANVVSVNRRGRTRGKHHLSRTHRTKDHSSSNSDPLFDILPKTTEDGALKNALKPFRHTSIRRNVKPCDPDLGILSCDVGEYCQKTSNGSSKRGGGVCVSLNNNNNNSENEELPPVEHSTVRNLQTYSLCNTGYAELELYIEYDADSFLYNSWGVIDLTAGGYVGPYDFPLIGPVDTTLADQKILCVPVSTNTLSLVVFDDDSDGIDFYQSGCGLTLNVYGERPFISEESPFFPYDPVYYTDEWYTCFKCPFSDCCYQLSACDNGTPLGTCDGTRRRRSTKSGPAGKNCKAGGRGGGKSAKKRA